MLLTRTEAALAEITTLGGAPLWAHGLMQKIHIHILWDTFPVPIRGSIYEGV